MKKCNECQTEKELSLFDKDKSKKDGVRYTCRDCERIRREKKKNKKFRTVVNSKEKAFLWLETNFPQYKILEWKDRGSDVLFLDSKRDKQFTCSFVILKKKLLAEPDTLFGASEEERLEHKRGRMVAKFGVEHPMKLQSVKDKVRETTKKIYGVENAFQINAPLYDGLSLKEQWAKCDNDISYSYFQQIANKYGIDFAKQWTKNTTVIEQKIKEILEHLNTQYVYDKPLNGANGKRPDFVVESKKLIIEADGCYHHSDAVIKDRNNSKNRKKLFESLGYKPLFFNHAEILEKPDIIESIIKNKLHLCQKMYARKCQVRELSREEATLFLEQNHLMGKGAGRCFALDNHGEIVCVFQIKCKNIQENVYELSRFCTKNGLSVVGGFSRLLKYAIKELKPSLLETFIDQKYGFGGYLSELGFTKETDYISFKWTDGRKVFNRMNFPGNTGYSHNLFKIWDCGQAKWILDLTKAK